MGHETALWARSPAVVESVNTRHENVVHLPGHPCPPGLRASNDLAAVLNGSELLLLVVPTQYIVDTLGAVAHLLRPHQMLVSCSKGIRLDSLETVAETLEGLVPLDCRGRLAYLSGPSFAAEVAAGQPTAVTIAAKMLVSCSKGIRLDSLETVAETLEGLVPLDCRGRLAYLSGPSFAAEVAAGQPTAVTIAAKDEALAARVQALLSTPRLRCYRSTDVVGVELGGALKNVLAIACGISDGLGFGNNGRAALITRGLYEITKLAVAMGANPLTMAGLAGMGDLVLTCTGDLSRNRTASMGGAVAEGVPTAVAIHQLAVKLGVECPIMEGIHRVIHAGANAQEVVTEVMSRELKPEVAPEIIRGAAAAAARPAAAKSMPQGANGTASGVEAGSTDRGVAVACRMGDGAGGAGEANGARSAAAAAASFLPADASRLLAAATAGAAVAAMAAVAAIRWLGRP
ncbi:hypothetical protein GPECTOR_5g246 [Gonium pectorale]|uniref:Glycerol-3-phosphate dehydrogenase [NAD(+)] n=1 Tax=Gonium pectorale TaxID=33097 RepID=A0A150GW75_GONPE|nr:hypothetical protein GPECTOR_5g246 [Gonium pectorale]|eukprot:KXZ54147.1 hypothetical protein GPECTOR_5g246 [Gonium pectorale]